MTTKRIHLPARFILLILLLLFRNPLFATNTQEGAKLFKVNCGMCHSIGSNKIIGPGLEGVTDRVPSPYEDWMAKWIKNNVGFRKSGNAYANQVFNDNNSTTMPVFEGILNDAQIKNIIAYLANPPKADAAITKEIQAASGTAGAEQVKTTKKPWIWLIVVGVLAIATVVLRTVRKTLQLVLSEKQHSAPPIDTNIWKDFKRWIYNNKTKFALVCISIFTLLSLYGWEYMWGIDVNQGYHPSQPINFIHKVHADDNGIACLYCHSGAEKGKVAGIPTLNVCMNCHKGIQGTNPEYQKEIAKIYYATGWDPVKGDYTNPQHPIEWNRVHSLPDFAYFNHAQHVIIGKIACQKCHGDCSSFTTNQQAATLTMGWCINCHRETPVQMEGNGYYTHLHQAIDKKFGADKKITEADMGGLECGKCHY